MTKSRKATKKKRIARRAPARKPRAIAPAQIAAAIAGLPPVGAPFHDGIYAGLSLENERPVALVLLPGDADDLTWEQAKAWAAEKEASLPSRIDQLVLFKNLKSQFQGAWYWSGEPNAGAESWAWGQYFYYGYQIITHKGTKFRARAVRRIAI